MSWLSWKVLLELLEKGFLQRKFYKWQTSNFFLAPSEQILQVLVRLKKDLFINVIQCFFKEQLNEMMQNPIGTPAPFWEGRGSQT